MSPNIPAEPFELDKIVDYFNELALRNPPQPPSPPASQVKRHKLLHIDFWFILLALGSALLMTSSYTLFNLRFEELVYINIFSLIVAMISNLNRDAETMHIYRFEVRKTRAPKLVRSQPKPPTKGGIWAELQRKAGITPRVH